MYNALGRLHRIVWAEDRHFVDREKNGKIEKQNICDIMKLL